MKAVVATSRMHESSRRRTDSCEMPNSDKTSRQGSIQKENTLDSLKEPIPIKEGSEQVEDGAVHVPSSPSPPLHPPHKSKPSALSGTMPVRPPLIAEVHRQTSVILKAPVVRPRVPKKSCSVEPGGKCEPLSTTPPSPKNLSNGFSVGVEAGGSTAECQ